VHQNTPSTECLEKYNEEYRLREQQGLYPPLVSANSSLDVEEESDGWRATSDRWDPAPPSPRAEAAAVELVPVGSAEAPATGPSFEAPADVTEAPQPSRKRKQGFSNLR
jgi:hypothetical protein